MPSATVVAEGGAAVAGLRPPFFHGGDPVPARTPRLLINCSILATGVEVAALTEHGTDVTVIATLAEFWADPAKHLSRPPDGPTLTTASIEQVPPVLPDARVICVGLNYLKHAAEGSYRDRELPPYPTLFARWTQSLTVDGAEVPVPANEEGLDWEGEVVAWVGAPLVDVSPEEALAAVIGYSVFNDLTARRAQKLTSQWILGKNGDRSGPLGPMVPASEVGDLRQGLRVQTRVNGETVQDARTDEMVYTVGDTLSLISHTLSVRSGDLLATGTPAGVGYARKPPRLLQPGDTVEVEVERLGVLRNTVVGNGRRLAG
jgi:2-keto-4-pentenoate hydratase/2-oxohepta-3-ene-1,7-dioic acid hydratase in catechol pathway